MPHRPSRGSTRDASPRARLAWDRKVCYESNSSPNESPYGHQKGMHPTSGPAGPTPTKHHKEKRKRWTREEYKEIMYCFYYALEKPQTNNTEDTFIAWCSRNSESEKIEGLDANKLANVRRFIMRSKKLSDVEIAQIKEIVLNDTREKDPVGLVKEVEEAQEDVEEVVVPYADENEPEQGMKNNEEQEQELNQDEVAEMRSDILEELSIVQHTSINDRESLLKVRRISKYRTIIDVGNEALKQLCNEMDPNLTKLNELIYATGKVLQKRCGVKHKRKQNSVRKPNKPKWQVKIDKEIENLRKEISLLEELQKDKEIRSGKARKVIRKYRIESNDKIPAIKEELKQKLQVKAQRVRRYVKRNKFYRQNKIFETDTKQFYREIGKSHINVDEIPSDEQVREYWSNIWGKEKGHNKNSAWLNDFENSANNIPEQGWEEIQVDEIRKALRKSHKWKSPGIDQIPIFWLDALHSAHTKLALNFNRLMADPTVTPKWFCLGTTYLLAKTNETANAKNYRPITCLPTSYKLLTSILTERTYAHMEDHNIFPIEQKGCRKGSYGCKDQLLVNKMILENARTKHKHLSTAWIDYKKAFDSVPTPGFYVV